MDDYHTIREQSVRELLAELLRHPPEGMQLVLVTRRDPLLPLAQLRAKGLVTEIRTEDLRFTTAESAALLQQWIETPVDKATISLLERTTEGWVTGLRLVVLSVRHRGDLDNLVAGLHGSSRYVTEYLMSEVLSRQLGRDSRVPCIVGGDSVDRRESLEKAEATIRSEVQE